MGRVNADPGQGCRHAAGLVRRYRRPEYLRATTDRRGVGPGSATAEIHSAPEARSTTALTVWTFDSQGGALLLSFVPDLGWKRVRGTDPVGS